MPAVTPEGEDSPKWSATIAARMEDNKPVPKPEFNTEFGSLTPRKTVLLKDYDPTTGWTPLHAEGAGRWLTLHAEGWQVANARVNCDRPGVPGHTVPLTSPSTWILPLATRSEGSEEQRCELTY